MLSLWAPATMSACEEVRGPDLWVAKPVSLLHSLQTNGGFKGAVRMENLNNHVIWKAQTSLV